MGESLVKVYERLISEEKTPEEKYGDGTTYKDSDGKTRVRKSHKKGHPKQKAYCARSAKQKQTEKVKVRRKDWSC